MTPPEIVWTYGLTVVIALLVVEEPIDAIFWPVALVMWLANTNEEDTKRN